VAVDRGQATRERSLLTGHIHEIDERDSGYEVRWETFSNREIRLEQGPSEATGQRDLKEMDVTHVTRGARGWTIGHPQ